MERFILSPPMVQGACRCPAVLPTDNVYGLAQRRGHVAHAPNGANQGKRPCKTTKWLTPRERNSPRHQSTSLPDCRIRGTTRKTPGAPNPCTKRHTPTATTTTTTIREPPTRVSSSFKAPPRPPVHQTVQVQAVTCFHLDVGDGRLERTAPVPQARVAVDETGLVEPAERLRHGACPGQNKAKFRGK